MKDKAHVIVLGMGLLNLAALPLWRLPVVTAATQAVGYTLLGLGLALNLLSFLALKHAASGHIEPIGDLVSSGIYARLRHPMYVSFAIIMLALDLTFGSVPGTLVTLLVFIPSLVWRARLEERALARRFGKDWQAYARRVPSLLLWDLAKGAGKRKDG